MKKIIFNFVFKNFLFIYLSLINVNYSSSNQPLNNNYIKKIKSACIKSVRYIIENPLGVFFLCSVLYLLLQNKYKSDSILELKKIFDNYFLENNYLVINNAEKINAIEEDIEKIIERHRKEASFLKEDFDKQIQEVEKNYQERMSLIASDLKSSELGYQKEINQRIWPLEINLNILKNKCNLLNEKIVNIEKKFSHEQEEHKKEMLQKIESVEKQINNKFEELNRKFNTNNGISDIVTDEK